MKILTTLSFFIFCSIFTTSHAMAQQVSDTLVVGVKNTPPFILKDASGHYAGISVHLWENIARAQGLPFKYKEYTLDGLLQALQSGEIDVCINPLTVTSERVSIFDFTQPFYITNLSIAVNSTEGGSKWLMFIRNFFSLQFFEAVLLLLLVLMVFGLLVWVFERKKNPEQFGAGLKGVWSGLWWSAVTMTTVGYGDKAPQTTGGRAVALIWMFTAIIIISGFTASIASALTVNQLESAIESPNDLKKVKTLCIEASTGAEYLEKRDIGYMPVTTVQDGLEKLAAGHASALVYDEPLLRYSIKQYNLSNRLRILPATFATQYYGFALPKNSPLLEQINPALLKQINGHNFEIVLEEFGLNDDQ